VAASGARERGAGARLVAVESAGEAASVALLGPGGSLEALRAVPRPASEGLLPTLLALLDEAGLAPAEVAAWAVSIGPGSFTGLRVGVATVKGLAFGGGASVAPVPTLAALAARGADEVGGAPVVAWLDARRGEVYAAAYPPGGALGPPRFGPTVLTPAALAERLAATGEPWLGVGERVPAVEAALRARLGEGVRLLVRAPDAGWVGRLGEQMLAAGQGVSPAALAPCYVRRAEAEVRRTGSRLEAAVFDTSRNLS